MAANKVDEEVHGAKAKPDDESCFNCSNHYTFPICKRGGDTVCLKNDDPDSDPYLADEVGRKTDGKFWCPEWDTN